jgi:hypothetical protein
VAAVGAQTTRPARKLIEFGWDEPDAAFLRKHIAEMEKTPFDGCVFHLTKEFLWHCWSRRAFAEAEMSPAVEDLKNTLVRKFTHNFLRFNVTPGDVDWFDDFGPILGNARLAARAAREGRAAGILFDIEQYNAQPFNYPSQRDAATRSWDQYATQARRRGREVTDAFQAEYPGLVILMTWAYSLPHRQAGTDAAKLATVEYGLLKPFLDGMFDAARGKTRVVDGYESSYGYREPNQFDEVVVNVKHKALPMIADVEKFRKHGSLGFGLWMDYDWRNKGWDANDFSKNHFTPDQFEKSLRKAMETSDEYVWIYTETPRWWSAPDAKPTALPREYERAVRRAAGRD